MTKPTLIPPYARHGSYVAYTYWNCRCDKCRAAKKAYDGRWRRAAFLAPDDPRHGDRSTYSNHCCRCEACREAQVRYERQRRDAKRL